VLTDEKEILGLKRRNLELQAENEKLKKENEELKKRLDRARGVPAVDLVAQMTGGKPTRGYKDSYDVETENGKRIEVKLSKVDIQPSKRWVWSNVLGRKGYDYLVLVGEKDERWLKQYPDLDYVFFLVPRNAVPEVKTNADGIALNTNFEKVRAPKSKALIKRYLVSSQEQFKDL
jgi:hypothetical protein